MAKLFERFRGKENSSKTPGSKRNGSSLGRISNADVKRAEELLQKYRKGKVNLDARIVDNEQWYKLRHWEQIRDKSKNPGDPEPASAWLLNAILNKHADALDNFPEPNVLPREAGDVGAAETLSAILPVVLEQNDYEQVYSDVWWYKLKQGTGVTGVFWDSTKQNGLGDIDIREADLLSMFWEPGIKDIQKSANLFVVELVAIDALKETYPQFADKNAGDVLGLAKYIYDDTVDTTDKVPVVDWYYKRKTGTKTVLHYCKFAAGEVLYASENVEEYQETGWYAHGLYPFVFDTVFPEEGTPCGFGYIDIMKSPQIYIDKIDQVMIKHAVMGARPRFFIRGDGSINEEEYADWTKDFVHVYGSLDPRDGVMPLEIPELSGSYMTVRQMKVDELKETAGNRDFAQGGTTSGVTAASAIAALQEAGNKLSRDIIKSSYRAFRQMCYLVIELMRQFYTEPRYFRITGRNGEPEFVAFDNSQLAPQEQGADFGLDLGAKQPVFDIRVIAQRSNPFNSITENERAKELYAMGFFQPERSDQALAALSMMRFDGVDRARERIARNGTMFQQIQQMRHQMLQMATIIDTMRGTNDMTASMARAFATEQMSNGVHVSAEAGKSNRDVRTDSLGRESGRNAIAEKARQRAAEGANPT